MEATFRSTDQDEKVRLAGLPGDDDPGAVEAEAVELIAVPHSGHTPDVLP